MALLDVFQKAAELLLGSSLGSEETKKKDEPDPYTQIELWDQDKREREIDIQEKLQNLQERKRYAKRIFIMLCVWLGVIIIIIVLSGIGEIPWTSLNFELAEAVLITLITTTTINVAGFFYAVTNHLFPSNNKNQPTSQA